MQRPVVRVWRALYGLPRAGEDWARTARQTLVAHGYVHVKDVAEESMFLREFEHTSQVVVLFVYTDDVGIAGPREEAILVHRHVGFLFGAGQEESYVLSDIEGIQRSLVQGTRARAPLNQPSSPKSIRMVVVGMDGWVVGKPSPKP